MRASPESLSRTRRNTGADIGIDYICYVCARAQSVIRSTANLQRPTSKHERPNGQTSNLQTVSLWKFGALAVGRFSIWELAVWMSGVDLGSLSQLESHEACDRDVLTEFR